MPFSLLSTKSYCFSLPYKGVRKFCYITAKKQAYERGVSTVCDIFTIITIEGNL